MKKPLVGLSSLIILAAWCTGAHALLIDRGGGLIYDSDQNITWLQDATYFSTLGNVPGDLGGRLWWDDATAWVDTLVYAGYDDWRLPTTLQPDPTCEFEFRGLSLGLNCTGSEMGHLFYVDLISHSNSGPFYNLQDSFYWSSTLVPSEFCDPCVFALDFGGGTLDTWTTQVGFGALPVRDGDVRRVPEPASIWLLGLGLAGAMFVRHRTPVRSAPQSRRFVARISLRVIAVGVLLGGMPTPAQALSYTFSTPEVPGVSGFIPRGINNSGDIVGIYGDGGLLSPALVSDPSSVVV